MRNLTQSTYDRIANQLRRSSGPGDRWADRHINAQDARDLLEAYESAVTLLDQLVHTNHDLAGSDFIESVDEFLYLPDRYPRVPRVTIDDGEPMTYSARGLLRPESDDYEP